MEWPPQDTGLFDLKMPCCRCGDGTIWDWGLNSFSELLRTTGSPIEPVKGFVVPESVWAQITGGILCFLGIQSDKTLWSCGRNANGQLGLGSTTDVNVLTQVGTGTNWRMVASSGSGSGTGQASSYGVKDDGTLWSWGDNTSGQLGLGTTGGAHNSPAQVGTDTDWVFVSAGHLFAMAIKSDGSLWSWGLNSSGQLGLGNTTDQTSPQSVGAATWLSVSCGPGFTMAIKSDSTLWSCGANSSGQLGLGTTGGTHNSLAQVGSSNWIAVDCKCAGGPPGQTFAIKSDGSLWSWGENGNGQLGLGDTTDRTSPTQVDAGVWIDVSCGRLYSMAVKNDGTLWGCGVNGTGQLGLGTTTGDQLTLIASGSRSDWNNIEAGSTSAYALA